MKISMSLWVDPQEPDKRAALTGGISATLMSSGLRIGTGLHRITITRVLLTVAQRKCLQDIHDTGEPRQLRSKKVVSRTRCIDVLQKLAEWDLIEPVDDTDDSKYQLTRNGVRILKEKP